MQFNIPLFPEQASTIASQVDAIYFFLIAIAVFFSTLIFLLVASFAVKYRRAKSAVATPIEGSLRLELLWTLIPLGISMVIFVWGARLYFTISRPPRDALEIYVVGKQWMWKFQHPTGQREINELHVPIGRPVRLTMASEDVIHSLYIPAFRLKKDVLPGGRYSSIWFEATKPGEYHLFCAEYCGTEHAEMGGRVVVMEPAQYQNWLSGGGSTESPVVAGENRFKQLGCHTCHSDKSDARGPALTALLGKSVPLQTGEQVTADEAYIRESILNPQAKIVSGYKPLMPTYQGLISEEGVLQIIAYIKSLGQSP